MINRSEMHLHSSALCVGGESERTINHHHLMFKRFALLHLLHCTNQSISERRGLGHVSEECD